MENHEIFETFLSFLETRGFMIERERETNKKKSARQTFANGRFPNSWKINFCEKGQN